MMNGSMRRGETRGEDEMRELEGGELKRKGIIIYKRTREEGKK